jgi:hypothetical protein
MAKTKKNTAKPAKRAKPLKKRKSNGQFIKGNTEGKGRVKGSKNKFTQELVDLVFNIEKELAEKKKGLKHCADQDPKWFYEKFLSKLLPKPIDVSGDISGKFIFEWEK